MPLDTVLFRGAATSIGQFRCPVQRPAFRDSGPIANAIVVFPRTSVWIQHEKSRPFVADPNVVTIYNRGQRYERAAISPDGDRCDWFAVSDELARDVVRSFDEQAADSATAFRFQHARSTPNLYVHQRRLSHRAARGAVDQLEAEEEVIGVVSSVIRLAYGADPLPLARRASAARRRRDLAEAAKAELLRALFANRSVDEIASALGTSAFHLCRVFRAHTGRTMHDYRNEIRVRAALELVGAERPGPTLSSIAHQLGFSSHAHLVRVTRRYLGATPRAVRDALLA